MKPCEDKKGTERMKMSPRRRRRSVRKSEIEPRPVISRTRKSTSCPPMSMGSLRPAENKIFPLEPILDKLVGQLVGIGKKSKLMFNNSGIMYASEILGYYLLFKKDEAIFEAWLIRQGGITNKLYRKQLVEDIVAYCQNVIF